MRLSREARVRESGLEVRRFAALGVARRRVQPIGLEITLPPKVSRGNVRWQARLAAGATRRRSRL
jgi:hypothetical protein